MHTLRRFDSESRDLSTILTATCKTSIHHSVLCSVHTKTDQSQLIL